MGYLMEFFFSKLQACKLQPLALRVFKAPDNVSYRVLSTETDATRFSAE